MSGKLTMIAAGDNLIHKTIVDKAWRPELGTHDFHFLYTPILDTIQSRDLAVINQETIFISDNSLISDYPTFGTPQIMGEALVDTGFDIVLSATNHTWDKGVRGVTDTLNYWKIFHPEKPNRCSLFLTAPLTQTLNFTYRTIIFPRQRKR